MSKRPGSLSFDDPMVKQRRTATADEAAKVMKIECQEKNSRSTPVTRKPAIAPPPATADQMLIPTARWPSASRR